jgi:hypothetical protein
LKRSLLFAIFVCLAWASVPCLAAAFNDLQFCWKSDGSADLYRYCNSWGAGTIHQVTPNPGSSSQVFDGAATAAGTADTWKVALTVDVTNYRRDMYIWSDSAGGIAAAGEALAWSTDTFTVSGGTGRYSMVYVLALDGALSTSAPFLFGPSFCAFLTVPQGVGKGNSYCLNSAQTVPSTFTLTETRLPFGAPVDATLMIGAYGWIASIDAQEVATIGRSTISGGMGSDFVAHLESILVTDANGNPIRGVSIASRNGIDYPLDPRNEAVPEPVWLSPVGLLALAIFPRFQHRS